MAERDADVSPARLFRDFIAFELKLGLDALKDILLAKLAFLTLIVELIFMRGRRGRLFYGLMNLGARFERWLGLYEPHGRTTSTEDEDVDVLARFGHANRLLRDAERRVFKTSAED